MVAALPPPSRRASITTSELAVGGLAVALLVLAETALALADLRSWSLPANVALTALVLLATTLAIARSWATPLIRHDRGQALGVLAVAAVAAVFAIPGFPVGHAGLDPGVYTNHGLAIERTGSYDVADPVRAKGDELPDLRPGVDS